MQGHYQINLFGDTEEMIRLYQAMDTLKSRYGAGKLVRAVAMDADRRVRMDMNIFKPKSS